MMGLALSDLQMLVETIQSAMVSAHTQAPETDNKELRKRIFETAAGKKCALAAKRE